MTPDAARASVDAAETAHTAAQRAEGAAVVALADAGEAYGDSPTDENERLWRAARDARELAALALKGAARKVAAARAELHQAEQDQARVDLARALPPASRPALFVALAPSISKVAAADAVSAVDIYQARDDAALLVALDAEHDRRIERARALRAIRRALDVQRSAVSAVLAASGVLGIKPPAVAEVPEAHLFAAVALEAYAPRAANTDDAWWSAWFVRFSGFGLTVDPDGAARALREAHGRDVAAWLDTARAVCVSGDPHATILSRRREAEAERQAIAQERADLAAA